MPYWLQDLWKDHKGKIGGIGAVVVILCLAALSIVPSVHQGDEIAALQDEVGVNTTDITDIFEDVGVNINDIAEINGWWDDFYNQEDANSDGVKDGTWFVYIQLVTDAFRAAGEDITALEDRMIIVEDWVADFYYGSPGTLSEWHLFLYGLDARISGIVSTATAGWGATIGINTTDIDGLEGWAETIDNWAGDNSGPNWDDYPYYTEE